MRSRRSYEAPMTAALVAAVITSATLSLLPAYTSRDSGGHARHLTLLEDQGLAALIPLLLPVVLAAAPLVFRGPAALRPAAWLLAGFNLLAGFTVGLFYLPSTALLFVATRRARDWHAHS